MKKLSLITSLVCLAGLTTQAKSVEKLEIKSVVKSLEICSNDGKIINKRYVAKHKGKKYVACCKACAVELLDRLEANS